MQLVHVHLVLNIIGLIVLHIIVQVIVAQLQQHINILILEVMFVLHHVIQELQFQHLVVYVVQHVNIT